MEPAPKRHVPLVFEGSLNPFRFDQDYNVQNQVVRTNPQELILSLTQQLADRKTVDVLAQLQDLSPVQQVKLH